MSREQEFRHVIKLLETAKLDRRGFLTLGAAGAGTLLLQPRSARAAEKPGPAPGSSLPGPEPPAWLPPPTWPGCWKAPKSP